MTLSSLERRAAAIDESVVGVRECPRHGYHRVRPWPSEGGGRIAPFVASRLVAGSGYSLMHAHEPLLPEAPDRVGLDVAWLRRWLDGEVRDD